MNADDEILQSFDGILSIYKMPIITIFRRPKDYPDSFVARIFDLENPTKYIIIAEMFADIRSYRPFYMGIFPRNDWDDYTIVESWI